MDHESLVELRRIAAERPHRGKPVFLLLAECMERLIRDKVWEDALRLPPDSVLAEKIGISHITLAKSLNELRKKELVQRSRSLGTFVYSPKENIRGTSAENSRKMVALLLDDINSQTIGSEFIRELLQNLEKAGIGVLLQSAGNRPAQHERQLLDAMLNPDCNGALVWTILSNEATGKVLEKQPAHWPVVFMNESPAVGHREYDAVIYDGLGAAYRIGDEFFASGGREAVLLTADWRLHYDSVRQRVQGLCQAAEKHHLPRESVRVVTYREREIPFEQLGSGKQRLLVFISDEDLSNTLSSMPEHGISIAQMEPWIGISYSQSRFVPASVPMYRFDSGLMASKAVDILTARLHGAQNAFKDIKISGKIIYNHNMKEV